MASWANIARYLRHSFQSFCHSWLACSDHHTLEHTGTEESSSAHFEEIRVARSAPEPVSADPSLSSIRGHTHQMPWVAWNAFEQCRQAKLFSGPILLPLSKSMNSCYYGDSSTNFQSNRKIQCRIHSPDHYDPQAPRVDDDSCLFHVNRRLCNGEIP